MVRQALTRRSGRAGFSLAGIHRARLRVDLHAARRPLRRAANGFWLHPPPWHTAAHSCAPPATVSLPRPHAVSTAACLPHYCSTPALLAPPRTAHVAGGPHAVPAAALGGRPPARDRAGSLPAHTPRRSAGRASARWGPTTRPPMCPVGSARAAGPPPPQTGRRYSRLPPAPATPGSAGSDHAG